LTARLHLGTRRGAAAVARRTPFGDFEIDGYFATRRRHTERHLERGLHARPRLRRTRARAATATEHRAEEIAESAETTDVEVLELEAAGSATGATATARTTTARAAHVECT